MTCEM